MKGIESILFDMDGVIVDSMRNHADAWKEVLGELGIELDDIDVFKREGMSGKSSIEDIFREKGLVPPEETEFEKIIRRKHEIFENNSFDLFPHAEEMLNYFSGRSILLALVTGSLLRSVKYLLSDKVLSLFNIIITAEDVSKGKPDPEPYRKALQALNVAPETSIVIENAPMGILSAKKAGIKCYALGTTLPLDYLKSADKVFIDHKSLFDHLKNVV